MDEIKTEVLRVFLRAIHSHLYSFALRFLFLQTHTTSEKRGKPERTQPPSLRNPYRNFKSENSLKVAAF
jgi:hypothetical protein